MKQKSKKKIWYTLSAVSFGLVLTSAILPVVANNINGQQTTQNISFSTTNNSAQARQLNPRADSFEPTNVPTTATIPSSLASLYPNQLIDTNQYDADLKTALINIITGAYGQLQFDDITIEYPKCVATNLSGYLDVVFTINNWKAIAFNESSGQYAPVASMEYKTTFSGMNAARPSSIPTNGSSIPVPSEYKSYNNVMIVYSKILEGTILPTLVGGTQLPSFSVEIVKTNYIFPNALDLTVMFNNYYDTNGNFVTNNYVPVKFTLTGFADLKNSNYVPNVAANGLGIYADELTLENGFELIKANFQNLSRELTVEDITNFNVDANLVDSTAIVTFDLINDLWVDNEVFPSKTITMKFTNFKQFDGTCINSVIYSGVSGFTSSYLKESAPNGDWKQNTTVMSILANNLSNSANGVKILPVDIQITNVKELDRIEGNNFNKIMVDFNLIHSKGKNVYGEIVRSLPLSTTITGFKKMKQATIAQEIIAKYPSSNGFGLTVLNNEFATQANDIELRNIIASSFVNNTNSINVNDIEITNKEPNINTGKIVVNFNVINSKYVDGSGRVVASQPMTVTIFGFKIFNGESKIGLVNSQKIQNSTLPQPYINTANDFDGNILGPLVRSYITGPVPSNFNINITDINPDIDNALVTFNATINNTYNADGTINPSTTLTGLQLTGLPTNSPIATYDYPFLAVGDGSADSTSLTIEDFRADPAAVNPIDQYAKIQEIIAREANNVSGVLKPSDVEIVGDPVFSAFDNSITVTYKILGKYTNDKGVIGDSAELVLKLVGFKPTPVIKTSDYSITAIPGQVFKDTYATDVQKEIEEIKKKQGVSQQDILNAIQIALSPYVDFNISNLDPRFTDISTFPNNSDSNAGELTGSLQVNLSSGRYYVQSGASGDSYISSANNIATEKVFGFASISGSAATSASAPAVIDAFASSINLNNINDYVTINNLPAGVVPEYIIDAQDTIQSNGVIQNYGQVTIKIKLSSYFNNLGELVQGEFTGEGSTLVIKTNPFLNTTLDIPSNTSIIPGKDLKSYLPSDVPTNVIKSVINANLVQAPALEEFDPNDDIEITKKEPNDIKGTLTINFSLTHYYDEGKITAVPKQYNNITITGFRQNSIEKLEQLPFYEEMWFFIVAGVSGTALLILLITWIAVKARNRRSDDDFYY